MRKCARYFPCGVWIMLELRWRPRAQLDRESIALFIGYERRAPQVALEAMRRIDAAIERVREFPDSGGHFRRDGLEHEYRTVIANPYIVFYRYDDQALTVYRVLHQRQDIDAYTLVDLL